MAAEHNFEKARLVQRVMRKSQFACPPANLLQPMFFWVGSSNNLYRWISVEALFSQPLSPLQLRLYKKRSYQNRKACSSTNTRTQKSWHSATVLSLPRARRRLILAIWRRRICGTMFTLTITRSKRNRADAVPIRARPGQSLPMMLTTAHQKCVICLIC